MVENNDQLSWLSCFGKYSFFCKHYIDFGKKDHDWEFMLLLRMLFPLATLAVLINVTQRDARLPGLHDALKRAMSVMVLFVLASAVAMHWHHRAECRREPSWFDNFRWVAGWFYWLAKRSDEKDMFATIGLTVWIVILWRTAPIMTNVKAASAFVCVVAKRLYELLEGVTIIDATLESIVEGHMPVIWASVIFCILTRVSLLMCFLEYLLAGTQLLFEIMYALAIITVIRVLLFLLWWAIREVAKMCGIDINLKIQQEFDKIRNGSKFFPATAGAKGTALVKADVHNVDAIKKHIAEKIPTAVGFRYLKPGRKRTKQAVWLHFEQNCTVDGFKPEQKHVKAVLEEHGINGDDKEGIRLYCMNELVHLGLLDTAK
jgi:hypothetical protein